MEAKTTATETKTEKIATQQESVVAPTATQIDFEAVLAEKDAELAQIGKEKENYRKAYLKKAGALSTDKETDNPESETTEDKMRRIAREELLSTREAQIQAEKDEIHKKSLKRIKELEVALKNRGQITSPSGQGSNQDKPESQVDDYLSNEQLTALKAKGWDDKKIETFKQNAKKASVMPR